MFKLFIGDIFIVCIFDELLKLCCGLLSSLDRIYNLYGMPWRIVLRYCGPKHCDGELLFWIIFCCLCNGVFKLSCWVFPSNCRRFIMHGMSRRVVLRYRGSDCSVGCVCSWLILGRVIN